MGTRCLTAFVDADGTEICRMYRQFDGYPEGHGRELVAFLTGRYLVNGFTREDEAGGKAANGMGDLAAQVVAHFKVKEPIGFFYLYPPNTEGVGEEFVYTVRPSRSWEGEGHGRIVVVVEWPVYNEDGSAKVDVKHKCLLGWPRKEPK